jgi:LysR family glycine cleavage system transcriptional activator
LGSFSLAAHDLALTQSAISHQIQNLESWLGQPVFRRMGRGVQLTAAGVLHPGRQRIDPYGNLESILIGCTPEFASGWLLSRLGELKARFPQLEVWLVTHQTLRDIDRIDVDNHHLNPVSGG